MRGSPTSRPPPAAPVYYGEASDYTHKGGVACTDILLAAQSERTEALNASMKATSARLNEWKERLRLPLPKH